MNFHLEPNPVARVAFITQTSFRRPGPTGHPSGPRIPAEQRRTRAVGLECSRPGAELRL